jgi:hypothetical protein
MAYMKDMRATNVAQRSEEGRRTEVEVRITLDLLRRCARANGFVVSADERVSECDAARLLEIHRDTLARMRHEGTGPTAYRIALHGARVSYRLLDLALWIQSRREKFDQ